VEGVVWWDRRGRSVLVDLDFQRESTPNWVQLTNVAEAELYRKNGHEGMDDAGEEKRERKNS
jgi:hypothetical protein